MPSWLPKGSCHRWSEGRVMLRRIIGLWILVLAVAHASVGDFSRYQVILDRRPFGEAPVEEQPAPPPPPVAKGPSFADSLRLVAMTISQGDIRVGFVDGAVRPPKTYFLFVGEEQDGIAVVAADYDTETVLLRKGAEERMLRMGGGAVGGGAAARAATAGASGQVEGGAGVAARVTRQPRVVSPGRAIRMEEELRRAEVVPELTGAVLERHLQEYNMQVIREGAPPLPIPLTPEQDAQLVQEGVLPPME